MRTAAEAASALAAWASPAAARNIAPLVETVAPLLPSAGTVLEVASGSGYHAAVLAAHAPHLHWQPTEADDHGCKRIATLIDEAGLPNLNPPLALDAAFAVWPLDWAEAVLCLNMIHIAPWSAALGLLAGAARLLPPGGPLMLYGPFMISGAHTSESNAAFDESLKARNPDWGVRDIADLDREARAVGLVRQNRFQMPANNMVLVYRPEA